MSRYEDFKYVLANWDINALPKVLPRNVVIPTNAKQIITIIGPRRAGKTFEMFGIIKNLVKTVNKSNILYINFEHERLRGVNALDLEDMLKAFYELYKPLQELPIYMFLDEIQNIEDWSIWLRRIHDDPKFRIYISGSSSKLLSKELATELRGRSIEFIILPFSFYEYVLLNKYKIDDIERLSYKEKRGEVLGLLTNYINLGGYPEVVLETDIPIKNKILESYYKTIVYKDVAERSKAKSISLVETFMDFAIAYYSKYLSITKIYTYLKGLGYKFRKQSLFDILKLSQDAFILFPIEIFSYKIKNRKQYPKKIYVIDNGIINVAHTEKSKSRLIENLVLIELERRSSLCSSFEIFYWKEYGKSEGKQVDFVIKKGMNVSQLIQVTYASTKDEINQREIDSLVIASNELKCNDLLVLTWDYSNKEISNGKNIFFMPLWKWLLIPDFPF
jgi:predicted AAA+ superfamily ATPase